MSGYGRDALIRIYRKRAGNYDLYARLFPLLGFRQQVYRTKAVQALNLRHGDIVVDIGCGTGLNFPLLEQAIGPEGKIVGVHLTDAMLAQAQRRVKENGWSNVELVQSDAAKFRFPTGLDGIISTYALTLVPEFDQVIRDGSQALKPGKRWAIADFKLSSNALSSLAPFLAHLLVQPFGGSLDMASRHPWEAMAQSLRTVRMAEFYMGFVYVAAGERGDVGCG